MCVFFPFFLISFPFVFLFLSRRGVEGRRGGGGGGGGMSENCEERERTMEGY